MEENAIVDDLIILAGGLNNNAYTNNINFSKKLQNEMVIFIYTNYEYHNLNKKDETVTECNCPQVDLSSCLNSGSSIIISNDNNNGAIDNNTTNDLININTANLSNLMSLNGIGEAKAKAIIKYRSDNGNFKKLDELLSVDGIGSKLYEEIKIYLTI